MKISENIALSFSSLLTNKLRTFLTILGIVVGIFSIIVIMTVITMLQTTIESGVAMLGKNTFQIQKYPAIQFGGPESRRKYRNREDLTLEEYQRLKSLLTNAEYIGAELWQWGRVVRFKNQKTNPNVMIAGITADAMFTNDWVVSNGRGIRDLDVERAELVCLLGQDIIDKLFTNIDPVGQVVKVDGTPLRVIGIIEPKGELFGQSRDNQIVIPISTFQNMYGERGRSINITISSYSELDYNDVLESAIGYMRTIRKVPPGRENDFEIFSNESLISDINSITQYVKIGAIVVSIIALIAAGVGIMNIMLVSVTERTKEIGIRKAIGARKRTILLQFLIESITLCLIGGFIGIILGIGTGNLAGSFLQATFAIPWDWVIIGIFLCVFIGVLFGTYPAYKAANLDPIEALRYE